MEGLPLLKTWGANITPDVYRVTDYFCPICGYHVSGLIHGDRPLFHLVVGFSTEHIRKSSSPDPQDQNIGAIVIECPIDHIRFWFHITQKTFDKIASQCPGWPRE